MKVKVSLGLIAAAIAFTVFGVTTAHADTSLCDNNYVCIFDHADYEGLLAKKVRGTGISNVPDRINDKMSSWINNTDTDARWFTDSYSNGYCQQMNLHGKLNYVGSAYNDRLTSWAANGGC